MPYIRRMPGVDLRQLRALLAVVDEGSFTDAAISLGTTQASVSRAIAALEEALGVRVLLRTSQGALPTVHGRRVVELARAVLGDIATIEGIAERSHGELRVGFAWSVFGEHTTAVQRRWNADHGPGTLTLVQSSTPTVGLLEGDTDLAILRRPLDDHRFTTSVVGIEQRFAALADDDPLSRRRSLSLSDLAARTVAIDTATGTTSTELWPVETRPPVVEVHGIDEWLTTVASAAAVGITSEATRNQFPRPGIRYRPLRNTPPIPVWLAWWSDNPPAQAAAFRQLVCQEYSHTGPAAN
jgi:DNA-binding transcriptional LysR family regulator